VDALPSHEVWADIVCPYREKLTKKRGLVEHADSCYYVQYLMAVPAHLLERFSPALRDVEKAAARPPSTLPLGLPLDEALPDQGLPQGTVIELCTSGGSALGTTVALAACRSAQQQAVVRGGEAAWCAFIDPSATLYAPGVERTGVVLERLLVVRPSLEALARAALRVVESRAFAVVVVDTTGVAGAALAVALGIWPRIVRRLSLAVEGTEAVVLLVTDRAAHRPLPLPVGQRIELERSTIDRLGVRVAKDRRGRVSAPRSVAWTREPIESIEQQGIIRLLA
jgi:hypothetical protein